MLAYRAIAFQGCASHIIGNLVQLPLADEVNELAAICHESELGPIDIRKRHTFHIGAAGADGCAYFVVLLFCICVSASYLLYLSVLHYQVNTFDCIKDS